MCEEFFKVGKGMQQQYLFKSPRDPLQLAFMPANTTLACYTKTDKHFEQSYVAHSIYSYSRHEYQVPS